MRQRIFSKWHTSTGTYIEVYENGTGESSQYLVPIYNKQSREIRFTRWRLTGIKENLRLAENYLDVYCMESCLEE